MLPLWLGAADAIRSRETARVHYAARRSGIETRLHHAARRRGCGLAAGGAGAADWEPRQHWPPLAYCSAPSLASNGVVS